MSSDDADSTPAILAPPFVIVDGILNVRSVGGYSIISGDSDVSLRSLIVKPAYLFRAAEPTRVTELGKAQLRALGVRKIFDFRSDSEIRKYKAATPELDDITIVRAPVSDDEAYDPASLALRVQAFETDAAQAFAKLYEGILDLAGPAFAKVLHHIRDNPDEPCLVHCTAGKDRTGVFAAVFLKFLGVSDEDIAKDYSLTEIGLEPMMPLLVARYRNEPVFKDKWEVTMKMASAKPETILATLDIVHKKYGGAENYLKEKAGLTDEDLEAIKKNVLVRKSSL